LRAVAGFRATPWGRLGVNALAGADKPCRIIRMETISGEQLVTPVTVPPKEVSDPRALFSTYRLSRKRTTRTKNRIHPPQPAFTVLFYPHLLGFAYFWCQNLS
jgi:hypothetical protein